MKFEEYYRSLRGKERDRYAQRAGTTRAYIEAHLLAPPERRKVARKKLVEGLAAASDGNCTVSEILEHFYELAASA